LTQRRGRWARGGGNDKDLAWMDDFCGFLMDPWKDAKIDLTTTKMKPAQGVACESLHTVKDGSPGDIEKGLQAVQATMNQK
jgi:hypothetical protein